MNKKYISNNTGITSVLILAVAIIILIAGIVLYSYFQTGGNEGVMDSFRNMVGYDDPNRTAEPQEISESDDVDTLEAEFESTVIGSPEEDFVELEQGIEEL
jgi:hypothetical protein